MKRVQQIQKYRERQKVVLTMRSESISEDLRIVLFYGHTLEKSGERVIIVILAVNTGWVSATHFSRPFCAFNGTDTFLFGSIKLSTQAQLMIMF